MPAQQSPSLSPEPSDHHVVVWTLWHPRPDVPDIECVAVGREYPSELRLVQGGLVLLSEPIGRGESVVTRAHRLREHFEAKGFVADLARASETSGRPGLSASLMALTDQARQSLNADEVALKRLPFRVGREARLARPTAVARERRKGLVPPTNDLYLLELAPHDRFQISRQHFQIERHGESFSVVDRGSDRGTIVAGRPIGGHGVGGVAPLHDLDVIIVGSDASPFVFKLRVNT